MAAPKIRLTASRGKLPAGMPPESGKLALVSEDPASPTSTLAKDLTRWMPSFTEAAQPAAPQPPGQALPRVDTGLLSERLQRAKSWNSGHRLPAGDEGAAATDVSREADAVVSAASVPSAAPPAAAASEGGAEHELPTTPRRRLSLRGLFGQRSPSSASVKQPPHEEQQQLAV